jgi:hypothetical protein
MSFDPIPVPILLSNFLYLIILFNPLTFSAALKTASGFGDMMANTTANIVFSQPT